MSSASYSGSSSRWPAAVVPSTAEKDPRSNTATIGSSRASAASGVSLRKAAKTSRGATSTRAARRHQARSSIAVSDMLVSTSAAYARRETPGHVLRRPGRDHLTSGLAALRPEVDDPVGLLDHVEVVLDHEHRVARVDEPLQHLEQLLDVGEVEAGRRLVEDVERPARRHLRQLGGQLDPLRLAARERRRRLTELDVVEADVVERLEAAAELRDLAEEGKRLLDRHVEDALRVFGKIPKLRRRLQTRL